jgi:hypothetical protein
MEEKQSQRIETHNQTGETEMNEITNISVEANTLSVQFVERERLIGRVAVYQEKYKDTWGNWSEFLQAYQNNDRSIDAENFELDEWAFLCVEFESELLRRDCFHGPPEQAELFGSPRPENDSGLSFWGPTCLTLTSTLSRCSEKSGNGTALRRSAAMLLRFLQ